MTGTVSFLTPVWNYVDALVHPSARQDALTAARHRAFIAPRLLGSLVALAGFPIYLVLRGAPGVIEVGVFAWLVAPILIFTYLSRTGRYERAHLLSSLSLTVLVDHGRCANRRHRLLRRDLAGGGAARSGALRLAPRDRAASLLALGAASALLAARALPVCCPRPWRRATQLLAALGIISAALYATGLALGAEQLTRANLSLLRSEEDRYRLLARNMTDVISRATARTARSCSSRRRPRRCSARRVSDLADMACSTAFMLPTARPISARSRMPRARAKTARSSSASAATPRCRRCRPLHLDRDALPSARSGAAKAEPAEREVVAVLRDISERKAQERALEQARAEAERANAAKSRFLATMSHELRTPLNAIIGFSDMLTNGSLTLDPRRRHEYAQLINKSGHHLLAVVNGILDMSKIETGNFEIAPEPFAPAPVIDDCCDLLALKARESGIGSTCDLPSDLPEIVADKRALQPDHASTCCRTPSSSPIAAAMSP